MRSSFRTSIAGLMGLVLAAGLCLAALRYPRVAIVGLLLLMALTFLVLLAFTVAGAVVLVRRRARRLDGGSPARGPWSSDAVVARRGPTG